MTRRKKIRTGVARIVTIYAVIMMQCAVLVAPLTTRAHAQEAVPTEPPVCVAPENTPRPTGASAPSFSWSCESNLWENAYYTWNPANGVRTPRFAPEHKLNESTNTWEVWEWIYIASRGGYEYRVTSTYAPAAPVTTEPTPAATISDTGSDSTNEMSNASGSINNTGPDSANTIHNTNGTISTTGPSSTNTIDLDPGVDTDVVIDVDIDVTNNVDSSAVSGDASVLQNTTAGNALSGDATAIANILNMLQSTWGLSGYSPDIYTANIQGDYTGDILINPSLLGISSGGCACGDLTVVSDVDGSITNNVNLLAQSGDATVSQNTAAGNANTGDASALANIINMINSSITAGESFLGILNISGNFTGDVLVAQDVIDELIAANVPTTEISLCSCGDVLAEFNNSQSIDNNITTTATSGSADVAYNTVGGSATTGSAETSVTVFNVTGRNVVGENALLVFVNVLGEWVGFITDAPSGATAAAFGGNLTENGLLSTNGDTGIDSDTDMSITNNIEVTAITGDAEVSYNTRAGDATSGDARANANVSNIMGSNFSLSGWFGMLFINVLGNWFGSFGVDTPYGNTALPPQPETYVQPSVATVSTTASASGGSGGLRRSNPNVRVFAAAIEEDSSGNVVLASVSETSPPTSTTAQSFGAPSSIQNALIGWSLLTAGIAITIYFFRRRVAG